MNSVLSCFICLSNEFNEKIVQKREKTKSAVLRFSSETTVQSPYPLFFVNQEY